MRHIDDELIEPAVVGRDAGATFQRQRVHPVHAEAALDDVSGGGLGGGEVAAFELHVDENVVAPFLVDEGRACRERIPHRHDRRQLLELDLHQSRDVFGLAGDEATAIATGSPTCLAFPAPAPANPTA